MIRTTSVSVLILFFLCTLSGLIEAETSHKAVPIEVIFDDETKVEGINLVLIDGMGYLSVDDVSKIFNTTTSWHSVSKKMSVTLGVDTIDFFVDSKKVIVNGKSKNMGKNTRFVDGTIMVPLEFFLTNAFGEIILGSVEWNYDKKVLRIHRDYNITDIRAYTHTKYTRIVIDTKQALKYTVVKQYPDKLMVTVYHGVLKSKDGSLKVNDGRVTKIDSKQDRRAGLFTIYMDNLGETYNDFQLDKPERIVIDIKGGEVAVVEKEAPAVSERPPVAVTKTVPEKSEEAKKPGKKSTKKETSVSKGSSGVGIKTIVIDPGHGGKDPGAVGRKGTKEKEIVLDIAKRLGRMLEDAGIKVIFTRTSDHFITLDDRARIANTNNADLFLSIHTNASISRRLDGFEIYFLSDTASDKESAAVAKIENAVINLEPDRKKDNLSKILWSMSLNEFMNESSELGSLIAKEVPKTTGIKNRGVKQAGFYVLRGAHMPAVLVEAGFISNHKEEQKLKTRAFRENMAKAIFDGIIKYKKSVE
ncbi:MAG: N-acetylmuramoyl-L-alanine amidase [bacterium]